MSEKQPTAEELRAAAARYEAIAQKYRELAALLDQAGSAPVEMDSSEREQSTSKKHYLHKTLLEKGPMTAKEIHDKTGMPLATIYFVCQDSKLFKKKGVLIYAVQKRSSSSSNRYGVSSDSRQTYDTSRESFDE